jgi:hypothetical protein
MKPIMHTTLGAVSACLLLTGTAMATPFSSPNGGGASDPSDHCKWRRKGDSRRTGRSSGTTWNGGRSYRPAIDGTRTG